MKTLRIEIKLHKNGLQYKSISIPITEATAQEINDYFNNYDPEDVLQPQIKVEGYKNIAVMVAIQDSEMNF